jgi:Tetracyclin repressor-like, C-terminal domain
MIIAHYANRLPEKDGLGFIPAFTKQRGPVWDVRPDADLTAAYARESERNRENAVQADTVAAAAGMNTWNWKFTATAAFAVAGFCALIGLTACSSSAERKIWGALLSLMASRDQVGWAWDSWLSERLKRHLKTDSRIELHVVRLAADGVWFERIMNAKPKHLKGVEEYLIEMTRIR